VAKKHNAKELREVIGALDLAGISGPDIHDRLLKGEAGLEYPVNISRRQVYYHRQHFRREHKAQADLDRPTESIEALKQRALELIGREIGALENRRPGTINSKESTALAAHYRTLLGMQRGEAVFTGRKRSAAQKGAEEPEGPSESAIDQLAREEQEAGEPPQQDQDSQEEEDTSPEQGLEPTGDGEGSEENRDNEPRQQGPSSSNLATIRFDPRQRPAQAA
jgi:hypothetical protein